MYTSCVKNSPLLQSTAHVNNPLDTEIYVLLDNILFLINTLRLRQNWHQFPEDILNAFSWMKIYKFWIRFPKGLIKNIPALV